MMPSAVSRAPWIQPTRSPSPFDCRHSTVSPRALARPRQAVRQVDDAGHQRAVLVAPLLLPPEAVVPAELALGEPARDDLDRRLLEHARGLALAASGARLRVHAREEAGVLAGARVVSELEGDRLVHDRAHPVAHVAAQAAKVEAGFGVHQAGETHAGVPDIGEVRLQRPGRARLHAGHVLAHFAGRAPSHEKRRPHRGILGQPGQRERGVGTIAHAQPAAHAGGEEILLIPRPGRAHRHRAVDQSRTR